MTSIQPISYPTWEYVLPYMSVDQRLVLSRRCPPIQNLDHRIPFKIQNLQVTDSSISVNNGQSTYQLGVIKIYPDKTPRDVQMANDAGGNPQDLERYGSSPYANLRISFYKTENLEKEVRELKMLAEIHRSLAPTEWRNRYLQEHESKILELRVEIEEIRKNGYIPPYTLYLQLIATTRFGRKVERFEYKTSISLATGYLFKTLFVIERPALVDTFELLGDLWMSLASSPRRLVIPDFNAHNQLMGLESELHFEMIHSTDEIVKAILEVGFRSEKHITAEVGSQRGARAMRRIGALPEAQLGETPGHVTVPNVNNFRITFWFEEESLELHAIVKRN